VAVPIRTLEWDELRLHELAATELSEELATAIHERHGHRIDVEFPSPRTGGKYRFKSRGCVGNLPVAEDLVVRVRPKVPVRSLFRMLEYAYDLDSFQVYEGDAGVGAIEEIYETLVSLLARRVLDRVRQGLYHHYKEEQETLPYVRGKVLALESLRAGGVAASRLVCEYEELTADVPDNQILAWTLGLLHRFPLEREDVREKVRRASRALVPLIEPRRMLPRDCVHRFYDRLNEDYRPMHALCRFFLEQSGPTLEGGDHSLLPFTLHMPTLFEAFVARWLQRHLPPGMSLSAQHHADLEPTGALSFKIDLVLSGEGTGDVLAVLDTKYKDTTLPAVDDIQQMVAYAARMRTRHAFLVYPARGARPLQLQVGDVKVGSLVFDLDARPEDAGARFLEELRRLLQ
jgi:5-methylcytosine-specific restriction enzyme subunit McrC